jgi:hypothetical protein
MIGFGGARTLSRGLPNEPGKATVGFADDDAERGENVPNSTA